MSKERFVLDNNNNVIDFEDNANKYCLSQEDVCNLLNKQVKLISELEQELAELKEKAIVPPVKVGQDIYIIFNEKVERRVVSKICIAKKGVNVNAVLYKKYGDYWCNRKFSTLNKTWWLSEQEAQDKLKEMNGEWVNEHIKTI